MNSIKIKNLSKCYDDFFAVDGLSFSVSKGEFVGFLGVNGAGKSTTINIMSTLLSPTGGTVEICGYDLSKANEIRSRIGVVYQENTLDDLLTAKENLINRGILYGISKPDTEKKIEQMSRAFGIKKILNRKYRVLSGGEKRRCEIAAALLHTPEILFLDEPTTGLDPEARTEVWNIIGKMQKKTKMTVFLTTHYMEEAAGADKIIIINCGKIAAYGTPSELKDKYAYDYLKIYSNNISKERLKELNYREENNCFVIKLKNTVEAIDIINRLSDCVNAFEVYQGTLDDVFITLTGAENI